MATIGFLLVPRGRSSSPSNKGHVIRMQSLKSRDDAFRLVAGQVSG